MLKDKKRALLSMTIIIASVILLAVHAMVLGWSYFAGSEYLGIGSFISVPERVLVTAALCVAWAGLAACITAWAKPRELKLLSATAFLASVVSCTAAAIENRVGSWLLIGNMQIYAPALTYLSWLFFALLIQNYHWFSARRILLLSLDLFFLPMALHVFAMRSYASGIAYGAAYLCILMKLSHDGRIARPRLVLVLHAAVLLILIGGCLATSGISLPVRTEVFLTQGTNDPYGNGWMYHHLISALRQTPFVGETAYSIPARAGTAIPAYLYFSSRDLGYAMAAFILKYGWISLLVTLGAPCAIIVSAFRLPAASQSVSFQYYAFSVASLFAIRLILSLVSTFMSFISGVFLLMGGNLTSASVDLILCVCLVTLYPRKNNCEQNLF